MSLNINFQKRYLNVRMFQTSRNITLSREIRKLSGNQLCPYPAWPKRVCFVTQTLRVPLNFRCDLRFINWETFFYYVSKYSSTKKVAHCPYFYFITQKYILKKKQLIVNVGKIILRFLDISEKLKIRYLNFTEAVNSRDQV